MTNSEAIEVLKKNYPAPCYESLREAVDAAINALSAQPLNVQLAYLKGLNDGIEQCTERLKRLNDEIRTQK